MILKFGGLVLLLAICGVFAEKKLQAFPTVDLASTLKHLSHLRRGLLSTHHSRVKDSVYLSSLSVVPALLFTNVTEKLKSRSDYFELTKHPNVQARSLQASRFRSLLQSTDATCAWDVDREECSLSTSTMKSLLESSNTDFSALISQDLECLEKTSREDCNAEDVCLWEQGWDECDYTDLRKGHESSPCAIAAPLFFDALEATTLCGKRDTRARCQRNRRCIWSVEDTSCVADFEYAYFGINNFDEKVSQVMDAQGVSPALEYAALSASDDFTWQSLLDHELSAIECPTDMEPLVCEYVDVLLSGMLGPTYYCSSKYESAASDCRADDLCRWNRTSADCDAAESVYASVFLAAITVLIDSMPDTEDKRIVEAISTCSSITRRRDCTGTCVWNPEGRECFASSLRITALYAGNPNDFTDPLCEFLNADEASHCYDQFTQANCSQTEFCRWNAEFNCVPNEEFYLSVAADEEPRLRRRYMRLKRQCSNHTTELACEA